MAFQKGGTVITTVGQHIGKAGVTQAQLTEIARVLGVNLPPTETIRTIVAFSEPQDKR